MCWFFASAEETAAFTIHSKANELQKKLSLGEVGNEKSLDDSG